MVSDRSYDDKVEHEYSLGEPASFVFGLYWPQEKMDDKLHENLVGNSCYSNSGLVFHTAAFASRNASNDYRIIVYYLASITPRFFWG